MTFGKESWSSSEVQFSASTESLQLGGIPDREKPVSFTLSVVWAGVKSETTEITFSGMPDDEGYIHIGIRQLLAAISDMLKPDVSKGEYGPGNLELLPKNVVLRAEQEEDSAVWNQYIIPGGCPDESEAGLFLDNSYLWTRRPQVSRAYRGAFDTVSVLCYKSTTLLYLIARVRFEDGKIEEVHLTDLFPYQGGYSYLYQADVSYRIVQDAVAKAGFASKRMVSYDILARYVGPSGRAEGTVYAHRFVVESGKVRTFVFRNSLGTFDCIHTVADAEMQVDSEVDVFSHAGVEQELRNVYKSVYTDSSGYLSSADEVAWWKEFLCSDERYFFQDGTLKRIVVEENETEIRQRSLCSLTFDWHFADEPVGTRNRRVETESLDARISLSPSRLDFIVDGGKQYINIRSNENWELDTFPVQVSKTKGDE